MHFATCFWQQNSVKLGVAKALKEEEELSEESGGVKSSAFFPKASSKITIYDMLKRSDK